MNRKARKLTRSLRILIVDNRHWQCREIERKLNLQGYYRIAPLRQLSELKAIIENALSPIDLVLVHHEISHDPDFDLWAYCLSNPIIRHFIIYADPQACDTAAPLRPTRVTIALSTAPGKEELARVMRVVEQGVQRFR